MSHFRSQIGTKLAYGFGSVAYGVKNNGFDYFLLIFYSQVLGVDAQLVGAALFLALVIDALTDPLIGYASDNTHSRWGRRHPYMYAAALPVAVAYYFLWNPPAGLTGNELFPFLLALSIVIRVMVTLYEVPCSALLPELTEDYDARTSFLSYRLFFGWTGGTVIATLALSFFLVPTERFSNGLMNVDGYTLYGVLASGIILLSILTAAIGTHNRIPHLKAPPSRAPMSPGRVLRDLWDTLATRSFLGLFLAAIFGAIGNGLAAGLNYYLVGFFWGFSTQQIAWLSLSIIGSAAISLVITPPLSRGLGKKQAAIVIGFIAFSLMPLLTVLRLLGLMPENGDPLLFPIILVGTVLDVALIISSSTLMQAMIADLVEEGEVRTARRSEGVYFAAITFTRKSVQGLGLLAATLVLTLAEFPKQVSPGAVDAGSLFRLGAYYAPTIFVIWMCMIGCLMLYRITRHDHEANLRKLAGGAAADSHL